MSHRTLVSSVTDLLGQIDTDGYHGDGTFDEAVAEIVRTVGVSTPVVHAAIRELSHNQNILEELAEKGVALTTNTLQTA